MTCTYQSGCSNAVPKARKPQYCNFHYKKRNSEVAAAAKSRPRRLSFIDLTTESEIRNQIDADFDLSMQLASPQKIQTRSTIVSQSDSKEIVREEANEFMELIDEETAKVNTSIRVKFHQLNSKRARVEAMEKAMKRMKEKKRKVTTMYQTMKELDKTFAPLNELIRKKKQRQSYHSHHDLYSAEFFFLLFSNFIEKGFCTQKQASEYFFIPPSTLSSKYNLWLKFQGAENGPGTVDRRGSPAKLTKEDDEKVKTILVDRIKSHKKTQNKHVPSIVSSVKPSVTSFSVASISRLKKRLNIASRNTAVTQKRANPF